MRTAILSISIAMSLGLFFYIYKRRMRKIIKLNKILIQEANKEIKI